MTGVRGYSDASIGVYTTNIPDNRSILHEITPLWNHAQARSRRIEQLILFITAI